MHHFEINENSFREGLKPKGGDRDLWFLEYQFLKKAKECINCLEDLRNMLIKGWEEAKEKEFERIKSIKGLYDDIILHNKRAFGSN